MSMSMSIAYPGAARAFLLPLRGALLIVLVILVLLVARRPVRLHAAIALAPVDVESNAAMRLLSTSSAPFSFLSSRDDGDGDGEFGMWRRAFRDSRFDGSNPRCRCRCRWLLVPYSIRLLVREGKFWISMHMPEIFS